MRATLTVLGSGTSMGVPTLGCDCRVCTSSDRHDRRTRPSVMIEFAGKVVLIDTTPDFHAQAIREGIQRVDAVFYTHAHADHILGLDDLRPLSFRHEDGAIPLFASPATAKSIRKVFHYMFEDRDPDYATLAKVRVIEIEGPLDVHGVRFEPIPLIHGKDTILGFRFGAAAYLTDFSEIPAASMERLRGLDVLFLDALRHRPHPTHSNVENSLRLVKELAPRRAYFTHISHDLPHHETNASFPANVRLAHDGLKLEFEITASHPMKIFRSLSEIPQDFGPTVISVGNFDGVHRAHQLVLQKIAERAHAIGGKSLAVTFDPHPTLVLRPEQAPKLLTPLEQKLTFLAQSGIDATLVLPFDLAFSKTSPREFAQQVLANALHAVEVHEGFNFHFGHKAEGNVRRLMELGEAAGFKVVEYPEMELRGHSVSSSRIRALIAAGEVARARALLGRPYSIVTTPAKGRGYGSKYTVPTINLAPYGGQLPGNGVYVTRTRIGNDVFDSVTNVGNRPTFGADSFAIESHLLDFHPIDLQEQTPIETCFLMRLRDEKRFDNPESLKQQIARDTEKAQRYFRRLQQ